MQANIKLKKELILILDDDEINWLKKITQNHTAIGEEGHNDRVIRERFFNATLTLPT